ncbi:MAG: LysE family translocator [Arenicella sp.]
MDIDLLAYLPQLTSVIFIAIFMAISPGSDFVMVTRNSIFHGRHSGIYSAFGVSLAIWIHVAYSIAGLAVIISNSIILFSIIKYLGAAYLIYIGWKTLRSQSALDIHPTQDQHLSTLSPFASFKIGFISNALNPKTTLFFLSIFTQVSTPETPVIMQIIYGAIISMAHLIWFVAVATFLSQPALLKKFYTYKRSIEKVIGSLLIGFGLKVALTSNT